MIRELDCVALTRNLPALGLKRGAVGVVVLVHGNAGYGVEFMTDEGETLLVASVDADRVEPLKAKRRVEGAVR